MSQGLKYSDAVKLLGGAGAGMKFADNLVGSVLLVGTGGGSEMALSLFDAKGEASRIGYQVAEKVTDLVRGQGRYHRSERLHAAHAVLVVSSFFDVFGDCLDGSGMRSPEFSRDDQLLLVATARAEGSWQSRLLDAPVPGPSPDLTFDRLLRTLTEWFEALSETLIKHLPGLSAWDDADDRARRAVRDVLTEVLPAAARNRYEEVARRLAVDIPEFAIWMTQTESRAASRGMERLEAMLLRATSQRDPGRHRAGLAAVYRHELDEPILGGDAGDLVMPSLGRAYLDPCFRARPGGPGTRPADEGWWSEADVRADFDEFLAVHLTTPQAAKVPLLLLGQPGGGKSSLTRILAARLPAADYLVVRVALREVRAESEVQDQIEQALRGTLGETVAWADLAATADGAMPVILLDGLDELLQATGVHQSGYLEQVAKFQQREARLGRPVAVIVTSRVAVADRARLPAGGIAVRLEPFAPSQVDRWLDIWTTVNAAYWEHTGRRPLTRDVTDRFPDLATQPLLLLMLALYDAGANALQTAEEFDTGRLYERLLHDFAGREVSRVHGDHLPEPDRATLIDEELLRLSVVAFAMFHRLRLWATAAELDADLTGLGLTPSGTSRTAGFQRPFTAGEEMVGRFFFIQRTQARQDDQTLRTYEFLHATFGEYLVARLVVQAVREAHALSRVRSLGIGARDDADLLRSLLGYTPLCARNTVLQFVTSLLPREEPAEEREELADVHEEQADVHEEQADVHEKPAEVRQWLVEQLRVAVTRPTWTPRRYQPIDKRTDHWMATYSFNLLLLTLSCGGRVRASELFRHAKDPAEWLRDSALQWRGAIPGGMWLDALKSLQVTRGWADDGRRDMVLEFVEEVTVGKDDPLWSHRIPPERAQQSGGVVDDFSENFPLISAVTSMTLSGTVSDDILRHHAEPVLDALTWPAMSTLVEHGTGDFASIAHSVLRVLLMDRSDTDELFRAYERVFHAFRECEWLDIEECQSGILRALTFDAHRFKSTDLVRWFRSGHMNLKLSPVLLECLARAQQAAPGTEDHEFRDFVTGFLVRNPAVLTPETCQRLLSVLPLMDGRAMERLLPRLEAGGGALPRRSGMGEGAVRGTGADG